MMRCLQCQSVSASSVSSEKDLNFKLCKLSLFKFVVNTYISFALLNKMKNTNPQL